MTWTVGSAIDDQQVGNTWSGERNLVSLSLSGNLNVFEPRMPERSTKVFSVSVVRLLCLSINSYIIPQAPQTAINAITTAKSDTFLTGTASGRVYSYSVTEGESATITGTSHSSYIAGLATLDKEDTIYSVGWDDNVREIFGDSFV